MISQKKVATMTYYVDFENKTDRTWTMGVYQEIPQSVGLDSVSWKQSTAPQGGSTGVEWEIDYLVAVANYKQTGAIGVYKSSQKLATKLGTKWEVIYKENVQQLNEIGTTQPGCIEIVNNSGKMANPGIGMSGAPSVFKRNVLGTSNTLFKVTPTYYVALFNQLELGAVISTVVSIAPLEVKFPQGTNKAVLTASLDGDNLKVDLQYQVASIVTQYQQVKAMMANQLISANVETRIGTGQHYTFAPGQVNENMTIENRHNVRGNLLYQIGNQPQVTVPIESNQDDTVIPGVNGLQLQVINNLPNSIYCIY